jgi:4-hydroxy-2-oxoheptanedioate aldolase
MRAPDGTFPSAEEHEAMIQRVIEIGKKVGTPTGIHAMDPTSARDRANQGMQFLAVGSDLRMMTFKAQEIISELNPAEEAKDLARY